ncbi:MAG: hypothetical protein ACJARS_000244 [bacterium]|jgi:hypothetical protein
MESDPPAAFTESRAAFEELVGRLQMKTMSAASHIDVERQMDEVGTALLRHLYQDHLSLRAEREDKRTRDRRRRPKADRGSEVVARADVAVRQCRGSALSDNETRRIRRSSTYGCAVEPGL